MNPQSPAKQLWTEKGTSAKLVPAKDGMGLGRSVSGRAEKADDDFSDIVKVQELGWVGIGWDGGGARHGLSH